MSADAGGVVEKVEDESHNYDFSLFGEMGDVRWLRREIWMRSSILDGNWKAPTAVRFPNQPDRGARRLLFAKSFRYLYIRVLLVWCFVRVTL